MAAALFFELDEEGFFDLGLEAHFPGGNHVCGVGVDGFFTREVPDGGEGFCGLVDFIVEAGFGGFDGGGDARDAGADDG